MRLLIIRHAEPKPFNTLDLLDPPLSEGGRRQATRLACALRHYALDRVICSTMLRSRETAEPLAEALSVPLLEEPDLVEIHIGKLYFWGEAEQEAWRRITSSWQAGELNTRCPEGESFAEMQARVVPVIHRLVATDWQQGFALIGHGVVNGVILATLCPELRNAFWQDLGHHHAGVWELEGQGLQFTLLRQNDISHLTD